ncbi:hypothetical protein [Simiduia aestuariiviva]|uniref:Uncharacterized protein n=1 Tax=Simiduia aestuariiviva TaxID=1510459 RepID=A0A839UK83_9GAMM|nr:hypothetical protein [Simiduia aestuariiviva]MBB3168033.1 hypothetical protein [Simiduia aestuariiviva]
MTDHTPDWASLVFDPTFLARVDKLALKRFGQPGLAEEAASFVLEGLSQNQWAACTHYSGRAKPLTYLLTLVNNLLEAFSRQRFGRPRPPEWLKREGDLWVQLWAKVCLERQLIPSVIDAYSSLREPDFIRDIIRTIKARLPWCGESQREIPADCFQCGTEDPHSPDIEDASIAQRLDEQALEVTLAHLHAVFFSADCPSDANMTNANIDPTTPRNANWQALRAQLDLTAQEHLLLKLVHQEGVKLNQVAKILAMPSYQPGRLLKALYARIAGALAACNITIDHTQLGGPDA